MAGSSPATAQPKAADLSQQQPATELAAALAAHTLDNTPSTTGQISNPQPDVQPAEAAMQPASAPAVGFRTMQRSEAAMDEVVHFQITHLGRQVLVWVGIGGAPAALGHLAMSMPGVPYGTNSAAAAKSQASAVATVLVPGPNADAAVALAQKLTKRFGVPILLAWNVPSAQPMLGAWAERRLVQHLQDVLQPA